MNILTNTPEASNYLFLKEIEVLNDLYHSMLDNGYSIMEISSFLKNKRIKISLVEQPGDLVPDLNGLPEKME
jgi:hypothetical protein